MGFADVHAHLTHHRLAVAETALVKRALENGITTIISNGLGPGDNQAVLELSKRHETVKPAFGFYPVNTVARELRELTGQGVEEAEDCDAEEGIAWLRNHLDRTVAVGEIGLDGHWIPVALWPRQEEVFSRLVKLAVEAGKPLIIHSRKRERRTFELLQELGANRVIWHCFGGKLKLAEHIAEHGHHFSIPANARRSDNFSRMLRALPRESIHLETDCPYLSPERGRDSEPADVLDTALYAADLWKTSLAEVRNRLADNFMSVFGREP